MHVQNKKYRNFVSISRLTGKCTARKFQNFCSSRLWTCLHHVVILRSQNKITYFLMILARLSQFAVSIYNTLRFVMCIGCTFLLFEILQH